MCELIEDFERFLIVDCRSVFAKKNVKFHKVRRKHHHGDYTCVIRNNQQTMDIAPELLETLLKERSPIWKDFIKFSVTDGRISAYFDRTLSFSYLIKYVIEKGEYYGLKKLINETFNITLDISNESKVTYLRGKLVAGVLRKLIQACGGKIVEQNDGIPPLPPNFHITVTNKNRESNCSNIFIQIGPVSTKNGSDPLSVEEYYIKRSSDIGDMCEYKLEVNEVTSNREDLVQATVVFDLIQSNIHKNLTLNMGTHNVDAKTSCKGALFVMYNYVRLVALIGKFDHLVSIEKYPPLPPYEEVDFSLLSHDAEWALMFDYVSHWPSIVEQSLNYFKEGKPKIHNICRFLMHFSTDFSCYYHRTRILTDSRPHLISVMYARIYLLKAILQVFRNALEVLSLRPLNQM